METDIETNWEMLCYDVLTVRQIELLKQKFELIKKERDETFIKLLKVEGCNTTRLKYWEKLLSDN